jgi:hypothetical protein
MGDVFEKISFCSHSKNRQPERGGLLKAQRRVVRIGLSFTMEAEQGDHQ